MGPCDSWPPEGSPPKASVSSMASGCATQCRGDRLLRRLAQSESARQVMGEPALRVIAHKLVAIVRATSPSTGCTGIPPREYVKRVLRKYSYPPELQDAAVQNVLRQGGRAFGGTDFLRFTAQRRRVATRLGGDRGSSEPFRAKA